MERLPGLIRVGCSTGPQGRAGETVPPAVWRNRRRSSAMSLAVRVPLRRPLRERLEADPLQFLGDRVVDLPGWASLSLGHLLDDLRE